MRQRWEMPATGGATSLRWRPTWAPPSSTAPRHAADMGTHVVIQHLHASQLSVLMANSVQHACRCNQHPMQAVMPGAVV